MDITTLLTQKIPQHNYLLFFYYYYVLITYDTSTKIYIYTFTDKQTFTTFIYLVYR